VHLRRALLLFALVLGLAAVAASVSRQESPGRGAAEPGSTTETAAEPRAPTVSPAPATPAGQLTVSLDADDAPVRRVPVDRPATVLVEVDEQGSVEIEGLGLSASADPLTPARFEVYATEPGRHEIVYTPAEGDEPRSAGTLVVRDDAG
jgi:hypothetical protein